MLAKTKTRAFGLSSLEEWQSVSSYVLKMKVYIDNLERLGHPVTLGLGVSLILIGLYKEYDGFMQNYNMHSPGKTINELHAMLKLHEQTLPKNNVSALHAIRAGCEALVKRDTLTKPDKLEPRSIKCIFRGYPKETIDPEFVKWLNAMKVEIQSMKVNKVYDLVELPPNGKTVGSKWLFKKKIDMDGALHTYKARLVAKGYTQTLKIDYEETFSPVAEIRAIRILIAIAAFYDYEIWQMDIKTDFLNGYLFEEVYMEQPEEHALKSLKKKEQSSAVVDPLAYLAKTTPTHSTTSPVTVPTPQSSGDSHNDAMLATMNQIANLLCGNTGTKGIQTTGSGVNNSGKKVICYNCRREGHVARQCKEPKHARDSQWYHDKAFLMQAKEKGAVLDAKAEAFLADVECTALYDQPLVLTTTNLFEANHEDAYDSDVDKGPHAFTAFMANISSTGGTNGSSSSHINEEEHLNSEVDSVLDHNMITYDEYQNDFGVETVPTV
nr:putative retrotransposon Ty1-copia subclass protein [Tanacetum cinerariifolium]